MTNPLRLLTLTAAGLISSAAPAAAGWDNVFQAACWHCKKQPVRSSYYAPPRATPSTAHTETVQRCEYEPITVLKPVTEQVAVPTVERRYYDEPVTTYSTRSYYNPETCREECVTVPRTSFVRKEECNTVMKYVERVRMVPTQSQRKVCYNTPVTTITQYGPTTKTYECDTCQLPPAGGATAPPRIDVDPGRGPTVTPERIPPQTMPGAGSQIKRQAAPYSGPLTARSVSRSNAAVRGEVVLSDRATPRPDAKVIFLSATNLDDRHETTADAYGNFDLDLPAGEWFVYLGTGTGRAAYQNTVTVGGAGKTLTVVSR